MEGDVEWVQQIPPLVDDDESHLDQSMTDQQEERPRLRVHIKKWHAIAAWHWDVHEDSCGICRMQFDTYCVDCKKPGDECPPIWGKCNHIFHLHCILKWIQQQGAEAHCPMCRQPWEFK
ncbi:zinc finger, C3HC4 type (RING finger) domain containing protein [Acanthamoeba castellanii str. Neff]|uniref:Anaphase-promoting complex subunit 11 n=1 Tax=Acanthamoeba castellanii (strain ATCC 30010 / Neff) TaxID=1257118 RepID=L8GVJ0_ACACF|nr:zinc finger, C3HC4 type (RING finger) domain containing protein [Acanthamoeba castellanii str. Neff]ELR16583.1 zinc finger, C3HC4 type (RING finger) domain containing protein [Acanthamoeba castellanii str. Neff]